MHISNNVHIDPFRPFRSTGFGDLDEHFNGLRDLRLEARNSDHREQSLWKLLFVDVHVANGVDRRLFLTTP